jgi:hypothetical protein
MSALTLPTPWLWASPLDFLHELKHALAEKVSDVLAQRRFDHRLQVLERLVTVWADDIRAAVTSADAESIASISLNLGQRTLPYYRALIPLALELGREPALPQALAEAAASMLWRLVREGAPEEVVEDAYLSSEAAEAHR